MLKFTKKVESPIETDLSLTLPFDSRQKARLHTHLDNGQEAGLFLPRGQVLRHGDQILAETGEIATIISAPENVSTVTSNDTHLLMRASYHLGNRHVPLEIKPGYLRFQYDHVLNEMLEQLNLNIIQESAPFEPEAGAYSYNHHTHSHE